MGGILNNKTRIMDTIVTLEGRRQMADGKLRIEYVSFTDNSTFYDPDVISGSADATSRLYFEQCHLPQDQITFECDDSGRLKPFKFSDQSASNTNIANGEIFVESNANLTFLDGGTFSSTAQNLLVSSIKNFDNLQLIATKDFVFEDDGFELGPSNINFIFDDKKPLSAGDTNYNDYSETRVLEEFPSLFYSKWLQNIINFKYLPPVNKNNDNSIDKAASDYLENNKIGDYTNLNSSLSNNFMTMMSSLSSLEKRGYKKDVIFDPTSMKNSLVCQFFEIGENRMTKLDVIDYGIHNINGSFKHLFFVGKIKEDSDSSQCFVNMFTLVFE